MKTPSISTRNLRLRSFNAADTQRFHEILSGEDILKYFPGSKIPSLAQVAKLIDRLETHWQEKGYGLWAIELGATGELVGRCGLQHLGETDEVEIDFILDRDHWGRGYATEAGKASLAYGFEQLKLSSIVGLVHPDNIASQKVLEKLGLHFVEEKEYFNMACYRYVKEQPRIE